MPVSKASIAKHLGVSPPLITRYTGEGMPLSSLAAAERWYESNVNRRVRGDEVPDYQQSRARREAAEADIAEQKAAELRGELIRRSSVEKAEEKKAAAVRESLLQMPAQLAPVVAAEADIAKCQDALMDAVLIVLGRISGAK
jgi:phage terminase Nu1 subunit (DNA packaging protein)